MMSPGYNNFNAAVWTKGIGYFGQNHQKYARVEWHFFRAMFCSQLTPDKSK
jgi:hypothetical protein